MAVTEAEVESLRFHLGYGNINGTGSSAYTPDGFKELFDQVVAPYLTTGAETTASTAATIGVTSVTVGALTDIVVNARLLVDVGDAAEIVVVRSLGVLSFTAAFAADHAAPFPVAVMGGQQRLRVLLHQADAAWRAMQSTDVGDVARLKRIEGELEWFPGGPLKELTAAYRSVVNELSRLTRVPPADAVVRTGQLEAY